MNPRRIGQVMGQGAQLAVNLMAMVMVFSGVYMIFTGDEDDSLLGAANTMLGANLFCLSSSAESEEMPQNSAKTEETD